MRWPDRDSVQSNSHRAALTNYPSFSHTVFSANETVDHMRLISL
jgi:hypothetical protein